MNEKIAVLAGGPSCEREISLISGKAVWEALSAKGFDVILIDPIGDFIQVLKESGITVVFIALHGAFGEDGTVQRMLDEENILYTGSPARVSETAFDKALAQSLFRKKEIRVPAFRALKEGQKPGLLEPLSFPVVVKPSKAGSSFGVSIVSDRGELWVALSEAYRYSDVALVEDYIRGRELTVGFLGNEPLPIVEVIVQRKFYDYEAKYRDSRTRYEFPAKLTEKEEAEVLHEAHEAYHALGCEGMGRVDIILGADGKPYVLEVNTIPGLTGKSLLPKAARSRGIEFPELCVKIIELSLKRDLSRSKAVSARI